MKTWNMPVMEEVSLKETAFGLTDPNIADSDKTQVELNGKWGYQQLYGEGSASNSKTESAE